VPAGYWNGWGGFSPTEGATLGSGLLANFVGIVVIFAWSGTLLGLTFTALKAAHFLRIPVEGELEGLDAHEFSPTKAYASVEEGVSPKPRGTQAQGQASPTKVHPEFPADAAEGQ
jgi:hypothetical protein